MIRVTADTKSKTVTIAFPDRPDLVLTRPQAKVLGIEIQLAIKKLKGENHQGQTREVRKGNKVIRRTR